MGAWGISTFQNDDAADWLYDLEETNDLSLLDSTFDRANSEYIESPDGSCILAAAEVLLALLGAKRDGIPENAVSWIKSNKTLDASGLKTRAHKAVMAVLSDKSELKELWQEGDDDEAWKAEVNSIINALL